MDVPEKNKQIEELLENYILAKSRSTINNSQSDKSITLIDHTTKAIQVALEDENIKNTNHEIFEQIILSILWHDIGKINYQFQKRVWKKDFLNVKDKLALIFDRTWPKNVRHDARHELFSVIYLLALYKNRLDKNKLKNIINSIAWHHANNLVSYEIIENKRKFHTFFGDILDSVDSKKVEEFLSEINNWIKNNHKIFEIFLEKIKLRVSEDQDKQRKEKFLDLLEKIKINFSNISDVTLEDLDLIDFTPSFYTIKEYPDDLDMVIINQKAINAMKFSGSLKKFDYLVSGLEELNHSNESINLSNIEEKELLEIINHEKNKIISNNNKKLWQEQILEEITDEELENNDIFILSAPTGSGKTLFAKLMWMRLFYKFRQIVYVLPYMAALNEKYETFSTEKKGLLHSYAILEIEREGKNRLPLYDLSKYEEAKMLVSKCYGYPIIFTTADQLLITSLEYAGCDLYIPLYEKAFFVIDEPQAYDDLQFAIILRTIEIIVAAKGKVLLMTATFDERWKKILEMKFENKVKTFDLKTNEKIKLKNYENYRYKIKFFTLKKEDQLMSKIKDLIKKNNNNGQEIKKILVVFNTVKKAVNFYDNLVSEIKNENIYLLHSRLLWNQKNEILYKIGVLADSNKNNPKDSWIVIATQVVEAALDIDADLLITEISPLESQIQRWGRVFRNRNISISDSGKPNIYVFANEDQKSELYDGIYPKIAIEKTMKILNEISEVEIINGKKIEEDLLKKYFEELSKQTIEELINNVVFVPTLAEITETRKEAHEIFRQTLTASIVVDNFFEGDKNSFKDYLKNSMTILLSNFEKLKRKGIIIEKGQKFGFIIVEISKDLFKDQNEDEIKSKIKNYGLEFLLYKDYKLSYEDFII